MNIANTRPEKSDGRARAKFKAHLKYRAIVTEGTPQRPEKCITYGIDSLCVWQLEGRDEKNRDWIMVLVRQEPM